VWSNADDHVAASRDAPLLTEFGATTKRSTLTTMVDRAAEHRTGWQYWAYCGCDDPTTTGPGSTQALVLDPAKAPRGRNLDPAKMRALVVPHPLAVSGTPRSYSYDRAAKVFRAVWSVRRAAGTGRFGRGSRTTVSVPRFVYRHGYAAHVTGGHVVSRPGARTLVVAQGRGVERVRVVVRPR
jgi:endoglycosylceramidase